MLHTKVCCLVLCWPTPLYTSHCSTPCLISFDYTSPHLTTPHHTTPHLTIRQLHRTHRTHRITVLCTKVSLLLTESVAQASSLLYCTPLWLYSVVHPPHPLHLTSPHLTSPHLTSPHLTCILCCIHLTSPHLTSITPLNHTHHTTLTSFSTDQEQQGEYHLWCHCECTW